MIDELAALVKGIDAAATDPELLKPLLCAMGRGQGGIFCGAALLKGGYAGGAFVVVGHQGLDVASARTWMRWPLRRLFARMKPSRIRYTSKPVYALAIPFSYGADRYVIVAPLAGRASAPEYDGFFTVLESVTVPQAAHAGAALSNVPATPMEPVIWGFALCDALRSRIEDLLNQRGWNLTCVLTYADLCRALRNSVPDLIIVDGTELDDPQVAMTNIQRVANSAALKVLAFTDELVSGCGTLPLVDRILAHDADREVAFKAIKELARESSVMRRSNICEADTAVRRRVEISLTPQELTELAALRAAEIMQGWACCVLTNEYGTRFRAEFPLGAKPIFAGIPQSFLSEAPFYELRMSERFLNEISDDPYECLRLVALKPLSSASVPIASPDGRRRGVLIACSLRHWADAEAFEELERLCRAVGTRFAELQPGSATIPEFLAERSWHHLRDRTVAIDVYRSNSCITPWRYRSLDETSGLLTLGVSDDSAVARDLGEVIPFDARAAAVRLAAADRPAFAAGIDLARESMTYASIGFSPPIALNRRGPAGSIASAAGTMTGVATLASDGGAAICDSQIWRWLDARAGNASLKALLDREKPLGLVTIVTLGSPPP